MSTEKVWVFNHSNIRACDENTPRVWLVGEAASWAGSGWAASPAIRRSW